MKKILLSVVGFAILLTNGYAQILSEDFTNGIPATWGTFNGDGKTANSYLDQAYGNGAAALWTTNAWIAFTNGQIASTSWYSPVGTADDWLATPAIAVTAQSYLIWDAQSGEPSKLEGYEVRVSTTAQSPMNTTNYSNVVATIAAEDSVIKTRLANLAAFAGQTIYIAFRNNSNDQFTLFLDNIIVENLSPNNVKITAARVSEEYVNTAKNVVVSGDYLNNGTATITALDVSWTDGANTYTTNLTGLNVPPHTSASFTHTTPLPVPSIGSYPILVAVNLSGDLDHSDDTLSTAAHFLATTPTKVVVGEEKTGTWCGFCPKGAVGLARMEANSNFIGIAVHNSDPMTISSYDVGTANYHPGFNGYPYGAVDRVIGGDPSTFNAMYPQRASAIVPCAVNNIVAFYNQATSMISVSADADFVGNVTGEYRMSCVIIEDDIQTTGNGWNQANYYTANAYGSLVDPVSGFEWHTAASSVVPTAFGGYDHVAISLSNNDILGDLGSIPIDPAIGTYNYNFTAISGAIVTDQSMVKTHAVVMIINARTGAIVNAGISSIAVVTSVDKIADAKFSLTVSPNPTSNNAEVAFHLATANNVRMEVYNAMGALVATKDAGTLAKGDHKMTFDGRDLNSGFYFINLTIGNHLITKKVTLMK
jgi:hypothetical protein